MPKADGAARPAVITDWGDFQLAMLRDEAYQRVVSATAAQRAVSRIETAFSSEVDDWNVVSLIWRQMLMGCEVAVMPTAEEIAMWRAIAFATNMPITFDEKGYLLEKEENDS